jgi:hypothetical protein
MDRAGADIKPSFEIGNEAWSALFHSGEPIFCGGAFSFIEHHFRIEKYLDRCIPTLS